MWVFRVYVDDNPINEYAEFEDALKCATKYHGNIEIERQRWARETAYQNGRPATSFKVVWKNGKVVASERFLKPCEER